MIEFLKLSKKRQLEIIEQVSTRSGLNTNAIEKDWWVTLALRAIFLTPFADKLLFKGGTSLSKSWALIERLSEDIDLVLDREVLGFTGELSKTQVGKLRKASSHFITTEFSNALNKTILQMGVDQQLFKLTVQPTDITDKDPQVLELQYLSLLDSDNYLAEKVLIEIGSRSLLEPADNKNIHSIIGQTFPNQSFSGEQFSILTVNPQRTFLEKLFLLHEEFAKPINKVRHQRMSRHLYDLEQIMDTQYGKAALQNVELYRLIIKHREKYTPMRGFNYTTLLPQTLNFIPPAEINQLWEQDYQIMQKSMIYGASLNYTQLIERLNELKNRVREVEIK